MDYIYEPAGWGDGDWWRRPNTIWDVGEVYARARREANRIRRDAFAASWQEHHPRGAFVDERCYGMWGVGR